MRGNPQTGSDFRDAVGGVQFSVHRSGCGGWGAICDVNPACRLGGTAPIHHPKPNMTDGSIDRPKYQQEQQRQTQRFCSRQARIEPIDVKRMLLQFFGCRNIYDARVVGHGAMPALSVGYHGCIKHTGQNWDSGLRNSARTSPYSSAAAAGEHPKRPAIAHGPFADPPGPVSPAWCPAKNAATDSSCKASREPKCL